MTSPVEEPGTTKLWLRSYEDSGFTFRDVSTRPPRDCTPEEVPIIDLGGINGDLSARRALAKTILHAAETTGFFYIKNHGVPEATIRDAHERTKELGSLSVLLTL